jgi:hypothetical protein
MVGVAKGEGVDGDHGKDELPRMKIQRTYSERERAGDPLPPSPALGPRGKGNWMGALHLMSDA